MTAHITLQHWHTFIHTSTPGFASNGQRSVVVFPVCKTSEQHREVFPYFPTKDFFLLNSLYETDTWPSDSALYLPQAVSLGLVDGVHHTQGDADDWEKSDDPAQNLCPHWVGVAGYRQRSVLNHAGDEDALETWIFFL